MTHGARDRARHPAGARRVPAHQQLGPPDRRALAHGLARQRPRLRRGAAPRHARRRRLRLLAGLGPADRRGAAGPRGREPFADPDARLLLYLALATIPGAVAGLLLDEWAETVFRSPALVALMMALMGLVLWLADRRANRSSGETVSLRDALLIGLAQACAIVPGTSRSGATISMALFLGHRREARPASASSSRCRSRRGPPSSRCRTCFAPRGTTAPCSPGCWRPPSRASWRSASCSPTCGRGTTCRSSSTGSPSRSSSGALLLVRRAHLG